jgi:ElaB/YqjD/DUF883 family membrane-anchored ribosome-binding protein
LFNPEDEEISMSDKDSAVSDLASDLAALRDDIARLSDAVTGLVRTQTDAAGAALKGAVGEAREHLSQAASQAQDGALGAVADLERRIEKNPLTAVLIAAGVGMVFGMMNRSRR